ncbi:MAG: class I SAM-dependent methyltransferase [Candidatus Omnitrophica bacterium]|nr:class I SAM-dependent methyltransferase [Candidatus Omnitrophota bacterium]
MEKFYDKSFCIDKKIMRSRIIHICSGWGWQTIIAYILSKKTSFKNLKIAEVGCGTGSFSLILNFLGADTMLIDADEDALAASKKVFALYNRHATFIKSDVLAPVPEDLIGSYDIVISCGLAEHFVGEDREKCFLFHKALLKKDGFAYIGVPNKFSLCYQIVRLFRKMTRTWGIKTEDPFTYWELQKVSKKVGFQKSVIIGNHFLREDIIIYSIGFISAVLDVLPPKVRAIRKRRKTKKCFDGEKGENQEERMVLDRVAHLKNGLKVKRKKIKDYFSAGLISFSFLNGEKDSDIYCENKKV